MVFGNQKWLASRKKELGSEVAQTAFGPVEFVRKGSPPYILVFHGTPGGYDLNVCDESFLDAGMGVITPSRPGYLRTPLATGRTFEEQADAFAALLDDLVIDQVVAHGISGGGPPAIQFAARHPERTRALLLSSAITQTHRYDFPGWSRFLLLSPTVNRLQVWMFNRFPKPIIQEGLRVESTYDASERARVASMIANDPEKLELIHQGMVSTTPMKPRIAGYDNDFEQWETMKELPLAAIHCPTLIAHGTADDDVPFSHAEAAYHSIPNAQLHRMEGAWHALWVDEGAEEMVRTQVEFAKAHGGA